MRDATEKNGSAWQEVKVGSAELYETVKEKGKDVYQAARTKGGEVLEYAREDYEKKKQAYREQGDNGPTAVE